jgi:hypothetical protein
MSFFNLVFTRFPIARWYSPILDEEIKGPRVWMFFVQGLSAGKNQSLDSNPVPSVSKCKLFLIHTWHRKVQGTHVLTLAPGGRRGETKTNNYWTHSIPGTHIILNSFQQPFNVGIISPMLHIRTFMNHKWDLNQFLSSTACILSMTQSCRQMF